LSSDVAQNALGVLLRAFLHWSIPSTRARCRRGLLASPCFECLAKYVSNAFAPARYPIPLVELRTAVVERAFDPVRLGGDIALNPSGVQRDRDLRESKLLVRPRPPRGRPRGGRAA